MLNPKTAQTKIGKIVSAHTLRLTEMQRHKRQYDGVHEAHIFAELVKHKKSKYFIKKTQSVIKRKVAGFLDTFLKQSTPFKINPFNDTDAPIAEILNNACLYYLKENNPFIEIEKAFLDMLIYGFGAIMLYFDDTVKVKHVSAVRLFVEPGATDINTARYVVYKANKYADRVLPFISNATNYQKIVNKNDDVIEITTIYERLDDGSYNSFSFWNNAFLFSGSLDALPFVGGYAIAKSSEIYENYNNSICYVGESQCEILKEYQEELNAIRNQMRDAVRLQLKPRLFNSAAGGLNKSMYHFSGPGDVIDCRDITGVQIMQPPHIIEANAELKNLDLEIQEISGVTAYNSGISRAGQMNQTATGMSILSGESSVILSAEILCLNATFFTPFAKRYAYLVYSHAPVDVLAKASGLQSLPSFDRSNMDFDVIVDTSQSGQNAQLRKQQLTSALQVEAQIGDNQAVGVINQELLPLLTQSGDAYNVNPPQMPPPQNQPQGAQNINVSK